jgi:glycosyltransferase involved in cell wall biosynthesis
MMNNVSITCVIPFYNEAGRIQSVLEHITKVSELAEIICVDDGSSDDTSANLRLKYPQVKIITLLKNVGKSAAVAAALPHISSSYVLLFDADIRNFSHLEISRAIALLDSSTDMLILAQSRDPWLLKLLRFNILNSGERIIKTNLLREIISIVKPKHYALEPTLNRWCYHHNANVCWIPFASDNYLKLKKWDTVSAITRSTQFIFSLLFTQSLFEFLKIQHYFYPKQITDPSVTQ